MIDTQFFKITFDFLFTLSAIVQKLDFELDVARSVLDFDFDFPLPFGLEIFDVFITGTSTGAVVDL